MIKFYLSQHKYKELQLGSVLQPDMTITPENMGPVIART